MTAKRRITAVLDGPPTPAWQARALAGLEALEDAEVVEVRFTGPPRRGRWQRLRAAVERHVFSVGADPHAETQVEPLARGGDVDGAPADAELVVWIAQRPLPDGENREVLAARHDGRCEPLEDAFRRAVLADRHPCVTSEIVHRRGDARTIAASTVSAAGPVSETVSLTLALWKLAALFPRAVGRLARPGEPAATERPPARRPLHAVLPRDVASWVRGPTIRVLFRRPWWVQVRQRQPSATAGWGSDEGLVRWGRGRMYADPFIVEHAGRHHLFLEEVPENEKQGIISHTELRLDGAAAEPPTPVLVLPFHLSYPCVFEHGEEMFMIPETNAIRRIELYRAIEFPTAWEHDCTLIEPINAVDTTFFEHDGLLWLFTAAAAEDASYSDELHLFWAQDLRGPWRAHPLNPVVSDVGGARPAGAIQRWGGRIVRPVQDCRRRYGWAVSFREVDLLSVDDYREHEVERLEPRDLPAARATHTNAADDRFEAVDLRRRELRPRRQRPGALLGRMRRTLR